MPTKNSPKITLPLLITKGVVCFPNSSKLIEAGREISINAIRKSKENHDSLIYIISQKDVTLENVSVNDLYSIGSLAKIASIIERDGHLRIRIENLQRVRLSNISYDDTNKYFLADGVLLKNVKLDKETNVAYLNQIRKFFEKNPSLMTYFPKSVINSVTNTLDTQSLADAIYNICNNIDIPSDKKQEIIELDDPLKMLEMTLGFLQGENSKQDIEKNLNNTIRLSAEKNQKEYFLREKLKAIKKELGEDIDSKNDPDTILCNLDKFPYPDNIKAKVRSEIKKYQMMPQGSLEAALILSYLDVIMSIPWWQKTSDDDDLKNVERILNEDHYGLEEPKKRIIEYLAVKKLTGTLKSPILCFYGPPGTGKTSLGKSIARALGRKFFKASLGGISDEAEIRGHRRTYVGSLPGRIIQGMRKVGVTNPVFLLDEVDKLASSYKGDPASALLEVLDPEQNFMFNDNYVEEPYDLSDVLFICTANYLENIPAPLRDRLELIQLSSYTAIEKLQIAKNHLIKKQIPLNGLKEEQVDFTDEGINYIITHYTREAGVRDLERRIASCLRKVAVAIVKKPSTKKVIIDEKKVKEFLGVEIFEDSKKEKEKQVGVVTGLAYTEYGGDILPIEVNYFKGKGNLILTGNLGDVMKESANIALDFVKANANKYGIDAKIFNENDIHIHVPDGAVPKDGPSAGVAITTAIISCLAKKPANPDVAMTGEVTLRGNALPIGGLREKSLAALRSGIKTIVVPNDNKKDVEELPKEVKETLKIVYMKKVDDAVKVILGNND